MSAFARGLKFFVIFNGVLLVAGTAALFTALYFREDDEIVTASDKPIPLPPEHRLMSVSYQNDTPHLLFETNGNYVLYRVSTGQTLEKVMEFSRP